MMAVARSIRADDSRGEHQEKTGAAEAPGYTKESWLLNVQIDVVNHKRSLQTDVFTTSEADLNRLSLEGKHAERMLLVPSGMVQVGERTESSQYRSARVEHLDLQGVKRGGCGGLSGINMQPEGQGRGGCGRRDCDRLGGSIGMSGSITILPCVPRSAVRGLRGGVVDDSRRQSPRGSGGAVLESRIANELRG